MGAWLSYGLGSMNENLPSFVTLVTKNKGGQPLVSRLWGSGFLPGKHAGTRFRADKDAILYLNSPQGISTRSRRNMLDRLKELHEIQLQRTGDEGLETKIAQYEMGFRMQSSIPEVTDLEGTLDSTFKLYGKDARKPGTFPANCLLAARACRKGVRFIQLYHPGWTSTAACQAESSGNAGNRPSFLCLGGGLETTRIAQGHPRYLGVNSVGPIIVRENSTARTLGDHHPRNFSTWFAGGGVKGGLTYGQSDDYSYSVAENGVPCMISMPPFCTCWGSTMNG